MHQYGTFSNLGVGYYGCFIGGPIQRWWYCRVPNNASEGHLLTKRTFLGNV